MDACHDVPCPYLSKEDVTLQSFNTWKTCIQQNLQHNENFKLFLPDGLYSTWHPRSEFSDDYQRIQCVDQDDPYNFKQELSTTVDDKEILSARNSQLSEFLNFINKYSNNIGRDVICDHSTSFEMIMYFLLECLGLEHKPGKLFDLCNFHLRANEDFGAFYVRFRSVICDNLKKRGDKVRFLDKRELCFEEDEILSPTFEEVIILWCLDKIDPNLPGEVYTNFSPQLLDKVSLSELQPEIFKLVPALVKPEKDGACHVQEKSDSCEEMENGVENGAKDENVTSFSDGENDYLIKEESLKSEEHFDLNNESHVSNGLLNKKSRKLKDHEIQSEDGKCQGTLCEDTFTSRLKLLSHSTEHKLKKTESLSCEECEKEFLDRRGLMRHRSSIHKLSHCCHICKTVFPNKRKLQIHLKEHDGYKCDECGKEHPHYRALYKHKRKHQQKLKCPECDQFLSDEKLLAKHMEKHSGQSQSRKPQKCVCPECGLTIVSQSNLNRHRKSCHTPQVKHLPCEFCGKLFANTWNLRSHLIVHNTDKAKRDFTCQTCNRSFYTEAERGSHVCKHYSCDTCSMKFIRERNLKLHKRSHAGETIFSCPQCEALFEKKKQLNSHKNTTHNERRKYSCDQCPKAFKTSSGLKQHILWHRGEKPFKCLSCDMSFITKAHLQSHSMTHTNEYPFECEGCGSKFRDIGQLKKHREKQMCGVTKHDLYRKDESKAFQLSNVILEQSKNLSM